jgi:hypothetical protein
MLVMNSYNAPTPVLYQKLYFLEGIIYPKFSFYSILITFSFLHVMNFTTAPPHSLPKMIFP